MAKSKSASAVAEPPVAEKPKSAASVAEKLREEQAKAKASQPATLETPAKGVTGRATGSFMIQAFGVMNIPVQYFKACDSDKLDTHMYHSPDCLHSVKQSHYCEFCNAKVEKALSVSGVEVGDQIILVTKDEMAMAKPASDSVCQIIEFVPKDSINVIYYESTDYLAPEKGKGGEKPFATLQQALANKERVAIAKFVTRGHQYTIAIRAEGQYGMVMSYLYADYEVRTCGKWVPVQTNPAEVALVEQLITETELAKDKFTPAGYDPYLANMREVIRKKMNGEEVKACYTEQTVKPTDTNDMLNLLKATLAQKKAAAAAK